jgi:small-conductance mechanosensitive channel
MDVQEALNLEILRRFRAEDIEFAYPTQTLIHRTENAGAVRRVQAAGTP